MAETPLSVAARRVIYHGRVQGVGFRVTTQQIARNFAVAGFVRNLADGTVELIVQGDDREIASFLRAITERMAANLSLTDEDHIPYDESLIGFVTR